MSRFKLWGSVLMVPVLGVALVSLGCGDKAKNEGGGGGGSQAQKGGTEGTKGAASKDKTGIVPTGWATLKGKVTFDGTAPAPKDIPLVDAQGKPNSNADYCKMGDPRELQDPSWIIGADKGVANVVVWIRPPAGKFFEIPADQQKPVQATVKVDQPFCAFRPHVAVIFPSFYDAQAKKQKSTGQVFEVVNTAKITHNTTWTPANTFVNSGDNKMMPSGHEEKVDLKAAKDSAAEGEDQITLKCSIHPWMTAYVWAFDHPYAAVTGPDGSYEIKNVPAGAEVEVVAWHEAASQGTNHYVLPEGKGSKNGEKMTLKDKDVKELNFKVSP